MASVNQIRNEIVDKLLTILNRNYLTALRNLVENSSVDGDKVKLTKEQILILK